MVSALGFGILRLPMLEDCKTVDEKKTIEMLRHGIDHGINYVDTARGYLGGQREKTVGKALAGGYRDRVYLATKLNLGGMKSEADFQRMFDTSRRDAGSFRQTLSTSIFCTTLPPGPGTAPSCSTGFWKRWSAAWRKAAFAT